MWSFIKICPICIIVINRLKERFHKKNTEYMLNYSLPRSCSLNLSSFWLVLKQQWTIEEISIFSNSSHLEWRTGLSDTNLKGIHPGTIPARFALIWFSGCRGEDLNVKVYDVGRRTPSDGKSSHGLWPGTLFTKHPLISGPVKLTEKLTGMSAKF